MSRRSSALAASMCSRRLAAELDRWCWLAPQKPSCAVGSLFMGGMQARQGDGIASSALCVSVFMCLRRLCGSDSSARHAHASSASVTMPLNHPWPSLRFAHACTHIHTRLCSTTSRSHSCSVRCRSLCPLRMFSMFSTFASRYRLCGPDGLRTWGMPQLSSKIPKE